MNARAIKKRLLKNAKRVFWGRRAFIGVRFPLEGVLPERPQGIVLPPEFMDSELFPGMVVPGMWIKENADGSQDVLHISHVQCSVPPEPEEGRTYYHIIPNRWGTGYQWWEVSLVKHGSEEAPGKMELDPEVAARLAQQAYEMEQWVETIRFGENNTDAFYHLMAPEWAAKTYYLYHDDNYYYLIWSVKYFYPWFLRKFSAAFRRSIMRLKKLGVEVKVVDSEPANAVFLC